MTNLLRKAVKTLSTISFSLLLLAAVPMSSQTADTPPPAAQKPAQTKAVHATQPRDGQQVFDENCERCHDAPQGFSPSISGTVVRHMRVRANLSKEDEQALLRFFNP